jgi:hypothetical protein
MAVGRPTCADLPTSWPREYGLMDAPDSDHPGGTVVNEERGRPPRRGAEAPRLARSECGGGMFTLEGTSSVHAGRGCLCHVERCHKPYERARCQAGGRCGRSERPGISSRHRTLSRRRQAESTVGSARWPGGVGRASRHVCLGAQRWSSSQSRQRSAPQSHRRNGPPFQPRSGPQQFGCVIRSFRRLLVAWASHLSSGLLDCAPNHARIPDRRRGNVDRGRRAGPR